MSLARPLHPYNVAEPDSLGSFHAPSYPDPASLHPRLQFRRTITDSPGTRGHVTLLLRNTLTRRLEPVPDPLESGADRRVRMYTCGPTVYRWAHVGNLRSYLLADLVRRALVYHGHEVVHVKNVTDVGHLRDERFDRGEDRMLVAAGLEDRSPADIADAYEAGFHADESLVNILPAHVFPRATEHIPEMLALIEQLVTSGHAYVSSAGNVYYRVASFPAYGRLSGNTLDHLRAGHRSDVEPDKEDPADFALWKPAGQGRLLSWPSPWGQGYPGWHIECSAMAMRYLGARFDIHTGGIDNVFPHHEDEIAQSAPIVGDIPARLWVHGEHLLMDGHKMAKSAGNFERVTDLAAAGVDPLAFRYLALTVRYGRKLNYSRPSLAAAAAGLASIRARLAELGPPPDSGPWVAPPVLAAGRAPARPAGVASGVAGHQDERRAGADVAAGASGADPWHRDRAHAPEAPLSPAGRVLHDRFVAAIDHDLDLPAAITVVREVLRSDLSPNERRWLVLDADLALGLDLHRAWVSDDNAATHAPSPEIERLIAARSEARANHDWSQADRLRDELHAAGYEVEDRADGGSIVRTVPRP
jgi:cysteinyl-tRNA synthetase